MINPLLVPFELPPFSNIKSDHVVPAITEAINNCRTVIKCIIDKSSPYTWDNLVRPFAEVEDRLDRIFLSISHLNAVKDSPKFRKAYEQTLPLLTNYATWLGQHKKLYQAYYELRESDNYKILDNAQKKSIDNTLLNFVLSGIELDKQKQSRYSEIVNRLSELSSMFSNNLLDSTMGWNKLITNKNDLIGVPKNSLIAAKVNAEKRSKDGWLLTLDMPSYLSIITYCDNSTIREEIYQAYSTRASEQGPNGGKWDNSLIIDEIITLRHDLALILGFNSYAEKSLVLKMAKSTSQVFDFLKNLTKLVRPQAQKELFQLRDFVKIKFGVDKIKSWDLAYYSEKQKQHLYNINDEQLREYFPENRVINGLFELVKRVFGIFVKECIDVDIYHPDVKFFHLFDELGELRGSFYLDLYAREHKRNGAWMTDLVNKTRKSNGSLQRPVSFITCNFNSPVQDKPALFTHNEVITLFHEFGHALHHIMTLVEAPGVSGINGVPWDAVELSSQFMENWCWEPEALVFISGHYETGESLPKKIIHQMINAKNYQSGLSIISQLEFSLFDFYLHATFNPKKKSQLFEISNKVRKLVSVIPKEKWNRFTHSFSHIFSGGYAAGYYSYLWADVLAADAYSKFKEDGIFNRQTGKLFIENILARGGSEDPMELFKRFRGREPQIDAMLEQRGIQRENNL